MMETLNAQKISTFSLSYYQPLFSMHFDFGVDHWNLPCFREKPNVNIEIKARSSNKLKKQNSV